MGQAVYQFHHFVVDAGAHALLKDGTRLSIQEQPFQVLLALVETPGQIVTRDELRLRLWGTTTFVDFDQSLNSALRRLRLALEDNSRDPVYIENVPRIGFRFLPPVAVETQLPFGRRGTPAAPAGPVPQLAAVSAFEASEQRFLQSTAR